MMKTALKTFLNKVREKGFFCAVWYTVCFAFEIPYRKLWLEPVKRSYSQAGEDLMLEKVLGRKAEGFYIDIGAYDPHELSNTKHFYQQGWRGINVEPNKFCHANFMKERPRDLNLNVGIDKERGELEFYVIDPATLSTFSKDEALGHEKLGHQIISKDRVKVITLADLFQEHVKDQPVDFMSIDAEGLDVSVMEGNDWNRWRPKAICIEVGDLASRDSIPLRTRQIVEFMNHIQYRPIQTTRLYGSALNMIFVAEELGSAKKNS